MNTVIISSGSEPPTPEKEVAQIPVSLSSGSEPPTPEKDVVTLSSDSDVGTPRKFKKMKLNYHQNTRSTYTSILLVLPSHGRSLNSGFLVP